MRGVSDPCQFFSHIYSISYLTQVRCSSWTRDALWRRRLAGDFAMCRDSKTAGGTPAPRHTRDLARTTASLSAAVIVARTITPSPEEFELFPCELRRHESRCYSPIYERCSHSRRGRSFPGGAASGAARSGRSDLPAPRPRRAVPRIGGAAASCGELRILEPDPARSRAQRHAPAHSRVGNAPKNPARD